ncbi:MAG TPA: ATP-binding cassette domain-containing protein [Gemmatimonadales bacterium]|jgi:ABC-2 type transport system ATP-binding protein|nr:ATP-binding cassette domain-containing protein [Gemmatimonadales bacterium]
MISVDQVTKRFGPLVAVDALSFQIDRGEVVGFLGPNGAGKTTTMRMLTGTLQPDAGEVLLDGQSIGDDPMAAKRRIGYLPESNPLYEEMLVCDYLEYTGQLRSLSGAVLRRAVRTAADETGLDAVFYRPINEASKGYRQRIGLAAAMLHRPDILVLDEPTEGLDPNQRVEIRKLVNALGRERTVLLSTHVMQEVEATCTRLLIVNQGKLVADGAVGDLLAGQVALTTYTVEAQGENVVAELAALAGVESHTVDAIEDRLRVRLVVRSAEDLRPRINALAHERNWTLWELHRERASLEQMFRELTVGGGAEHAE